MIIVVCHRYSQNYSGPYKPKEPLLGRYDGLEQTKLEGRFTKVGSGIDVGDGGHSSDNDEVSGQGDDDQGDDDQSDDDDEAKRKVNWAACRLSVGMLTAWLCRRRKRKLKSVRF